MFSFFKRPKARQFEYAPRLYDPIKEEIKERTERIKREMNPSSEIELSQLERAERIRHGLREGRTASSSSAIPQKGILGRRAIVMVWLTAMLFSYMYGGPAFLGGAAALGALYIFLSFRR